MIRATLYITVQEGRGDEFVRAWRQIAEQVRREPGSLRQALLSDPDDPNAYVIASDWDTPERFRAFEQSPEQDELTAPLRELRASARMTVQNVLEYVEGGGA
jgi:heme-degrading monooxygenase HmoA